MSPRTALVPCLPPQELKNTRLKIQLLAFAAEFNCCYFCQSFWTWQDESNKYQEKVNSRYIPQKDRKATGDWIKRQNLPQEASDHQKEGSSPNAALGETAKERTWDRMHGRTEKWWTQKSLLPSLEVLKYDCSQSLSISSRLPVLQKVGPDNLSRSLSTWAPLWLSRSPIKLLSLPMAPSGL